MKHCTYTSGEPQEPVLDRKWNKQTDWSGRVRTAAKQQTAGQDRTALKLEVGAGIMELRYKCTYFTQARRLRVE